MIQEIGYQHVVIARSGTTGLRAAQKEKPSLILLDIDMPGMNGLEVLKLLKTKQRTRNIPVIMLTGLDNDTTREIALSDYAQEYLTKPVTMDALQSAINRTLIYFNPGLLVEK
jgi:two-component system phosphate regulon response regulator PhoB